MISRNELSDLIGEELLLPDDRVAEILSPNTEEEYLVKGKWLSEQEYSHLGQNYEQRRVKPNTEDDVEKLMFDAIQKARGNDYETFYKLAAKNCADVYKQAKSETMFSFDILNLLKENGYYDNAVYDLIKDYIESLNKPKEYEFVVEMEELSSTGITDSGRQTREIPD